MEIAGPEVALIGGFAALTLAAALRRAFGLHLPLDVHLPHLWAFFLFFTLSETIDFRIAVWVLALLSFVALREYFSLIDLRLQDRWGVLGAYLSIPFMFYFVQIEWYGMFVVSIPVYAFLVIPFLVTLGGREADGTVLSIGAIDFGLFLFVFCVGHIGYLGLLSTWMAVTLVLAVTWCDFARLWIPRRDGRSLTAYALRYLASAPVTVLLATALSPWSGIPARHGIVLGLLIPVLVIMGRHTMRYVEADLRVVAEDLLPGKGRIIDGLGSFLYVSPVVFHYIRYYLT